MNLKQRIKSSKILRTLLSPVILIRRAWLGKNIDFDSFYSSVFSNVIEGSLVVVANDFRGSFEIDFRSHLLKRLLKYKDYELELVKLIEKYLPADKDVIDVGANVGLFTVLFSKLIENKNKVLAIEPTPAALAFLEANVNRNSCNKKVIIHSGVASNSEGSFSINVIPGMEEYTSMGKIVHESARDKISNSIKVEGKTIDSLVGKYGINPGFIKIDTEGSEYKVLKGAEGILKKYKPIVLSELSEKLLIEQSASCFEVYDFFKGLGYRVVDAYTLLEVTSPIEGEIIAFPNK